MTNQLQENMSNKARAQRRALMEPIPSQINAMPRVAYINMAGKRLEKLTCGFVAVVVADIACPARMRRTSNPAIQPNKMVKIPKTTKPVERSL